MSQLKFVSVILISLFFSSAYAQILQPVSWSFDQIQVGEAEFKLEFKADIDPGWTIYSYFLDDEAGPVPTMVEYEDLGTVQLIGDPAEMGSRKEGIDPVFDAYVTKYLSDKPYVLEQKVMLSGTKSTVSGYLTFMTCDDKKCLPPTDIDFQFVLNADEIKTSVSNPENFQSEIAITDFTPADLDNSMLDPVKWEFGLDKENEEQYTVNFTAKIKEGWTIYSYYTEEGGPIPTLISFDDEGSIELLDEPVENGIRKEGPDPLFDGLNVIKFLSGEKYSISQKIKLNKEINKLKGYITYMTCDDESCIPFDKDFVFDTRSMTGSLASAFPIEKIIADDNVINQQRPTIVRTYENPIADCGEGLNDKDQSAIWMFVLGFLGGLLALLTPCVFPMIPLTVSFFTKDTKRKGWWNGTIYGISIVVIYVTIGLTLSAVFGEEALNRFSTNWIANSLFFIIFLLFAFSFFGFYEITLPSSWVNQSDKMSDRGGLIGIFFMAFTLALVSFSCTGPIIGTAIVQAASNQVGPFIVMLGFSLALAIPFGFFAAFPSWLNSLPQSGSWMNSVKVVLGFLELALAFKFLSVADMTNNWGFLRYELFLGLWVLIFAGMTLYLFGILKFPHDSPLKRLSPVRWGFALGSLALTLYLVTGFFYRDDINSYNSLKLMSGLAPPAQYNYFLKEAELDHELKTKYPSYSKCANNIDCFKDYYEGLAYAKENGKPIFLDMTGHGCVNCRKTEEHIWVDKNIRNSLSNDFVMISLYVDDDKKLDETLISKIRNKKIRNVGNKWADFQIVNFKQNSQPLYVMMTPEEEVITKPRGYKEGVAGYKKYLECGLDTYVNINGNEN